MRANVVITERIIVDPAAPAITAIDRAAAVLRAGGLVAFPTETVYGLGACADDAACVSKIYAAKGRPERNPIIVHVTDAQAAAAIAGQWPDAAARLAAEFWPGPLTLIVPRGTRIPPITSAGLDSLAVRAPDHPVAQALLRALGRPIAAPSANLSSRVSPTTAGHVLSQLDGLIDMVLDAGPCRVGIESTVVDVRHVPATVLRRGAVSLRQLSAILGADAVTDAIETPARRALGAHPSVRAVADADAGPRASPGLDRRHYAPRTPARLLPRTEIAAIVAAPEGVIGVLSRGTAIGLGATLEATLPDAPEPFAAGLYATLHTLDDAGCTEILVEAVPGDDRWAAVRDRLERACAS